MGLFGATLFYGDSVITPAISVLSAVEGLEVAAPVLKPYVVPLTVAILIGLYTLQSRGTAGNKIYKVDGYASDLSVAEQKIVSCLPGLIWSSPHVYHQSC